jgi:hypothetical protein
VRLTKDTQAEEFWATQSKENKGLIKLGEAKSWTFSLGPVSTIITPKQNQERN